MLSTYPTVFGDRYTDSAAQRVYWDNLTAGIKARIPGADVAYATEIPTRAAESPVSIENRERSSGEGTLKLPLTVVSENYFSVLGIKLRSGRFFDNTDDGGSLAVAGLTNPEIADALFLSKKTVEGHLHHAYRKLGVRSRSDLKGGAIPAQRND